MTDTPTTAEKGNWSDQLNKLVSDVQSDIDNGGYDSIEEVFFSLAVVTVRKYVELGGDTLAGALGAIEESVEEGDVEPELESEDIPDTGEDEYPEHLTEPQDDSSEVAAERAEDTNP